METTEKIIIYQVFTRLFGNQNKTCRPNGSLEENGCGKMNDFTKQALHEIKKLGATHIWYTGLIAHASQTDYTAYGISKNHPSIVKGKAGSPYAIRDYYDIDPDLAEHVDKRMEEFEHLVTRSHECGLKVIMDFVPNHVARQYHSLAKPAGVKDLGENDDCSQDFNPQNNFYYIPGQKLAGEIDLYDPEQGNYEEMPAKATGNDHFDNHPGINDWYETVKLNYGIDYCDAGGRSYHFAPVPDTWHKMRDILSFWAAKGVDGFRCDMAEMVPSEFWYWCIGKIKTDYPDIVFIGEVYNPSLYRSYLGSGFDYLYDKVGMYDCLCRVIRGESAASDITYQWQAVDDIKEHMLYFLENHDELRLASDFLSGNAYKALPAVVVSALLYNNPFMLYAGQEFGERGMDKEGFSGLDGRTTIFDYWTVASLYNGYVNRRKLTSDEKRLEKAYSAILNIVKKEKAVSEGMFFDLMYVNPKSDIFDSHRQYAFLRKADNEVLLVVVNFSDSDVTCGVNIPRHAFDYMQMAEKSVNATDLLTGDTVMLPLKADSAVELNIPAYGARIYKFLV